MSRSSASDSSMSSERSCTSSRTTHLRSTASEEKNEEVAGRERVRSGTRRRKRMRCEEDHMRLRLHVGEMTSASRSHPRRSSHTLKC
eukprot:6196534-Pleurochrysis_carterae.AAC.7